MTPVTFDRSRRPLLLFGGLLIGLALVVPAVALAVTAGSATSAAATAPAGSDAPSAAASRTPMSGMVMGDVPPVPDTSTSAQPPAGNGLLFRSTCTPSHMAPDDPIVFPGEPGASHLHVFFGNITTDASSTLASLQNQPTSCRISADHAAYWVPALIQDGRAVAPLFANAYYLAAGARGHVVAFPQGLEMIAGNSEATSPQATSIVGWKCAEQVAPQLSTTPGLCPANVDQVLVIRFPDCWNGQTLDSPDHKSHLAYRVGGICPAGYAVAVPQLSFNVHYRLTSLVDLGFSSGSIDTAHADFFNAWNQMVLNSLVTRNLR